MADSRMPPIGSKNPPAPLHQAGDSPFAAGTKAGQDAAGLSRAMVVSADDDGAFTGVDGFARVWAVLDADVAEVDAAAEHPPVATTTTSTHTVHSTVTSTSAAATTTTTTTTTSMTVAPDNAQLQQWRREQDKEALSNPGELVKRANLRDDLLAAIAKYDVAAIATLRAKMPKGVTMASYLPIPNAENVPVSLIKLALTYHDQVEQDHDLLHYATWCANLHDVEKLRPKAMAAIAASPHALKPKVRDLCIALRTLDDTADEASLKKSATSIKKMLKDNQRITVQTLAQQPFAGTRMMLQKCTLLSKYIDGTTLNKFRAKVEQAHQERKHATAQLPVELLKKTVDAKTVTALCVTVFARRETGALVNFLRSGFTKAQLQTMFTTLHRVIASSRKLLNPLLESLRS